MRILEKRWTASPFFLSFLLLSTICHFLLGSQRIGIKESAVYACVRLSTFENLAIYIIGCYAVKTDRFKIAGKCILSFFFYVSLCPYTKFTE
jgi:hypothetical protein